MKARFVVGAALGSTLFAACLAGPEDPGATPAEPVGQTAAALAAPAPSATPHPRPVRADGLLPGMVAFHPNGGPKGTGPKQSAMPICANPHLTYFGGPILQSPVIVAVFWTSSVHPLVQANIGQFYADVTKSSYWRWLHEYDTVGLTGGTNQAILPGSLGGNVVISPLKCAPGGSNCQLTDQDIQDELARQIKLGFLPAPTLDCTGNTNTIYMVDLPPNISLSGPGGSGNSCVSMGFCAYHGTGTYGPSNIPLVYAANMDLFTGPCSFGCGGNATPLQDTTSLHSHELVEAVTDADIGLVTGNNYAFPAAWGDNNNMCGEIADICADGSPGDIITVAGRSWTVQPEWSNLQNKCTSTGPAPAICTGTTVAGCRKCSCGDDGVACNGAAAVCETTSTNVLFGACEQCTAGTGTCTLGATCQQSPTPALDDLCVICTPKTTCPAGDNCGSLPDGCGGTIVCGACTFPQTCGGGSPSNPHVCGCTPKTSCPAGDNCGTVPDGCGGAVSCGTCPAPQTCGTPGNPNQCTCTPKTTCPAGDNCGTVPDGCGGVVTCGACTAPQSCGGGSPSNPNLCGCTPKTSCPAGDNCGTVSDGCGGVVSCGTCTTPQTCGIPGNPNQCSCTPKTSCPAGDNCGTVADGCGGVVSCGACASPQTCGGGSPSNPNVCGCTPKTSCPPGDNCGTAPDGCGGVVSCGACASPQTCGGGSPSNANVCGCTPKTSCPPGDNCGTVADGCGGVVSCGACAFPQTCGGGSPSNPNVCGCTPNTGCLPGDNCGTVGDGCGGVVSCGGCAFPQTCGGGSPSLPNVCGCTPKTSCPPGDNCGTVADGCGGVVSCGGCAFPQTCGGGSPSNPNVCGCTPKTSCPAGDTCGTVPNGCGGAVLCGACGANQLCMGNQCVAQPPDGGMNAGASSASSASSASAGAGGGSSSSSGEGGGFPLSGRAGCSVVAAPDPATGSLAAWLGLAGLAGLGLRRRRTVKGSAGETSA